MDGHTGPTKQARTVRTCPGEESDKRENTQESRGKK